MTIASRGQALAFFALVLPLVLLPVVAYASESSMLAARQARLTEATMLAALDAAQQLDIPRFRAGLGAAPDPVLAAGTATAELAASEPGAVIDSIAVNGSLVTVAVHEWVPLQIATFVRGGGVTLHATAAAILTPGYQAPG
jgi:hypothetical protein